MSRITYSNCPSNPAIFSGRAILKLFLWAFAIISPIFGRPSYLSISFCWPPNATTVRMPASTSSATAPAYITATHHDVAFFFGI
jgi:hypothetical protein